MPLLTAAPGCKRVAVALIARQTQPPDPTILHLPVLIVCHILHNVADVLQRADKNLKQSMRRLGFLCSADNCLAEVLNSDRAPHLCCQHCSRWALQDLRLLLERT